jgi:hypothetical protein
MPHNTAVERDGHKLRLEKKKKRGRKKGAASIAPHGMTTWCITTAPNTPDTLVAPETL